LQVFKTANIFVNSNISNILAVSLSIDIISRFVSLSLVTVQARNQRPEGRAIRQLPSRNFHKRMYLLGTATSYIIFPPRKYQLVAALS